MYCEKCGKILGPGERCTCDGGDQNNGNGKNSRNRFSIYAVIGFLLFAFGVELAYYFYTVDDNFLTLIPVEILEKQELYLSGALLLILFLCGMLCAGKAIKRSRAVGSVVLFMNLIAFLAVGAGLGIEANRSFHSTTNSGNESAPGLVTETEVQSEIQTESESETDSEQALTEAGSETDSEQGLTAEEESEFVSEVLMRADQLVQQGEIQKAKDMLSQASGVTANEDIQAKLEELELQEDAIQGKEQEETTIHRYEYSFVDGTWEDAYRLCRSYGGHLVTFDSQEEFDYVSEELLSMNLQDNIFYIGGRRDLDSTEYYWVDNENNLTGNVLNDANAWYAKCWLHDEPSFKDDTLGVKEHVLSMFYYDDIGRWVWNDVPNDLLNAAPSYAGKVGFICEYED